MEATKQNVAHTPGPWNSHPDYPAWHTGDAKLWPQVWADGLGGGGVALCVEHNFGRDVAAANARLIAAAPDLLAACEAVLPLLQNTGNPMTFRVQAAIARATGGEPTQRKGGKA